MPCLSYASSPQLKEGNRQFKKGNYEKALKLYEDALIDAPYSTVLHFNAGDAAYQTGDFARAETLFSEAAKTPDPVLKGGAHYNRGNALFRQGRWDDAVEAYKDSLRANPHDADAKYNLTIALNAQKNPPAAPQKPSSGPPKPEDKSGGQKDGPGGRQEGEEKPGRMSREDAERLLAAAAAGEKKKAPNAPKTDAPKRDDDW